MKRFSSRIGTMMFFGIVIWFFVYVVKHVLSGTPQPNRVENEPPPERPQMRLSPKARESSRPANPGASLAPVEPTKPLRE